MEQLLAIKIYQNSYLTNVKKMTRHQNENGNHQIPPQLSVNLHQDRQLDVVDRRK